MASYNNSNTTRTNVYKSYNEPEQLRLFRIVLIGVLILASLVGNTVVIKAILGKRCRPFVYCLVTNLAVAELVSTVFIPFIVTYSELTTWVFGDFLCRLILPLNSVVRIVVTSTIAVISVRRFQVVTGIGLNFPSTKKGAWIVIGGIWGYAFAISSPLFIYYRTTTQYTIKAVYCLAIYPDTGSFYGDISQRYFIARTVLSYGIQVLIMVISYGAVTFSFKRQIQSIIKNARPRVDSTQSNTRITDYNLDAHRTSSPPSFHQMVPLQQIIARAQEEQNTQTKPEVNILIDQEGDLTKMFYTIVLLFIILYMPSNIFHVFEIYKGWSYYTFVIRKWLAVLSYLTLALHPLCYGTMSRFYAKAFKKLILCKC